MKNRILFIFLAIIIWGCLHHKKTDKASKEDQWVFILAGQSNMAGRGIVEPQDTISDPDILTLNREMEVVPAKEPLHFYEPKLAGLDCGLSFAKELRSQIPDDIRIVLVPCAVGGSSVDQWIGDSLHRNIKLYSNFKKRVDYAKTLGTIKGVLWHQGESDANANMLPLYQNQLVRLFQNFRSGIGLKKVPIFAAELGEYSEPEERRKNWAMLNKILNNMAKTDDNLYIVSSKGLKSNPDKVHFNAEAQRELGKRFAERFLTMKERAK